MFLRAKCVLAVFLLVFPTFLSAQFNVRFNGEAGVDLSKELTTGFSVRVGAYHAFSESFFLGATAGITKLTGKGNLCIPFSGKLLLSFGGVRDITPFVDVEPGYGYYKETIKLNGVDSVIRGGFCFFGGGGISYSTENDVRYTFTFGFSSFAFVSSGDILINRRLSVRVGIAL